MSHFIEKIKQNYIFTEEGKVSEVLKKVHVDYVENEKCKSKKNKKNDFTIQFCAGGKKGT